MEDAMTRLHRKVRERIHASGPRVRRVNAKPRTKLAPEELLPDLSELILYGQG
jgi:hypothetical protein